MPKMQGAAGDYVFDELSKEEWSNYKELIKCLKRCFHKVESTKTNAAIFWKHDHKASEKTYVTELKRVYGKVYPQHDSTSWDEDLLCRFLNGLIDQKAHQQVEFVKDQASIDEALDEIIRCWQFHQSGQPQSDNSSKAFKAQAACVNDIPSSDGDLDSDEGDESNQVARANFKFSRQSQGTGQTSSACQLPKTKESLNVSAPACTLVDPVVQMKSIIAAETEKCLNSIKELLAIRRSK